MGLVVVFSCFGYDISLTLLEHEKEGPIKYDITLVAANRGRGN